MSQARFHWINVCQRILRVSAGILFLFAPLKAVLADSTWVFAVQITALIQQSPPAITLTWEPDMYGATGYTISRKAKTDTSWGNPIAVLSGSISNYTDFNVQAGSAYEYQIYKTSVMGYVGYGYIYAGINAPLTENRGKLLLMVATNATAGLSTELARLQSDLMGDGWQVIRHDVSSNDAPASVKSLIVADYNSDPSNVKTVFLFGHVPVLLSGNLNYDTHENRPMPADAYYGDVDGNWSSSPDYLPSDVELMVGRVDLFNLPGNTSPGLMPNETELMRRYLNKDHNWRFKQISVPRRALMADRFGAVDGEGVASTGYRNFTPLVGHGNIVLADWSDAAPAANRWISMISAGAYLWSYGCGGGQDTSISELGLHGEYNDAWSTDIVGQDARAVFFMFEGSWFGVWDHTDNLERSVLATPTMGLAVCSIAGQPHWFVHHMGLGETIGYGTRLTMNNSTLYKGETNEFMRAIYISLLGDPSLRMEPVAAPSSLAAAAGSGNVALQWGASSDPIAGYNVYRASQSGGPFTKINGVMIQGTGFTDSPLSAGTYTYMVRAILLQTNFCGSYYNPSQGVFAAATVSATAPPIVVNARRSGNSLNLAWNAQSGVVYRVWSKTNLTESTWTDLSGPITGSGSSGSWSDTNISAQKARFYRIGTP
jgi:hypothetical protein